MKKILVGFLLVGLLAGCTSREQEEKIDAFWEGQFMALAGKLGAKIPHKKLPGKRLRSAVAAKPQTAVAAGPITATLFLSDSCGWCNKLKRSGFVEKFQNKYQGDVELTVYEVHSAIGRQEFSKAVQKHHLSGGVPLLIIGSSVIHGYSDQMMELADEKVNLEFKKVGYLPGQNLPTGPRVESISMEDEMIQGPATQEDKASMKAYLNKVREDNQATLVSIKSMLPRAVWQEAMDIVSKTETALKEQANQSVSYADFKQKAAALIQQQQQQIDALVRQNAGKIRKLK